MSPFSIEILWEGSDSQSLQSPLPPGSPRKVLAPVLRGPRDRRQCTYGAAAVVSYLEPPEEEPPATDEACSAGARAPCPGSKSRSPESIRIYNPIYNVDLKYIYKYNNNI